METQLTFSRDYRGRYVSNEVAVGGSFALHLERTDGGWLDIFQRSTSSGGFAPCALPAALNRNQGRTVDWQFLTALPLTVRIESESEVTDGKIVTADE